MTAQWAGLTPHWVCLSSYAGRLKKPKVTWSLGPTEDGICRVSLTCSVEDNGHNVTYRWTPLQKGAVVSQGGSHLSVSWRRGENHPNFTCTASNPVSNSSGQFLPGDICPGCPLSPLGRTSGPWILRSKSLHSEWFFMKCCERVWARALYSAIPIETEGEPHMSFKFSNSHAEKAKRNR